LSFTFVKSYLDEKTIGYPFARLFS
jgi:hypothetical protein